MLQIREIYVAELPSPNVFASDETWPESAEEWAKLGLEVYAIDGFDKSYRIEAGKQYEAINVLPEPYDQNKRATVVLR
jgi:hypothetical protein